ncbi:MAG: PHP domain-containing protein [Acidimicrobiia bacterium]|nr:PHP domain-containing protein [Acidimicrobiia bacterium]
MSGQERAVEALERAAYLLERALSPTAKVKAFRRAAEVVSGLGPGELERLAAAGRVTELAGVGPSTGGVVDDAVAGRPSAYLDRLEEETAVPIGEGGALRDALLGDCHLHSTWSDGGASITEMAEAAQALGHEWLVLSDHSPRMSVARGLTPERMVAQHAEIAEVNEAMAPFRVLRGMEVDINEDGSLDFPDELLAQLDVVVASPHIKLGMERPAMTRRLVLAVANPNVDVLGHCTGRKVGWGGSRPRPPASFDAEVVFAACQRFGVAVEVNCRPERQDPPDELLALALEWGCDLAVDTDAHAPGQLEWQAYGCDRLARLGIGPERVLNARNAEDVLAHLAQRSSG